MIDDMRAEVESLETEVARQQATAMALESEVADLHRDMTAFAERYDQIIGPIQGMIEAVKASIAELERQRFEEQFDDARPLESWTTPDAYEPVEEQFKRAWNAEPPPTSSAFDSDLLPVTDGDEPDPQLKQLYRQLARRYHPDLAADAAERERRTRLMTVINQAYEAHDLDTLQMLLDSAGDDPDAPFAILRLQELHQLTDILAARISGLKAERTRLITHDLMILRVDEKLARFQGRDLLREVADKLEREYDGLMARWDRMRGIEGDAMNNGTLILVRHGQSQWNLENRFTGWVDVPLTTEGEAEARRAGELLRDYHFDCAFTSALSRAQETLRIILEVIGQTDIPIERDQALNERYYGSLQGLNKAETAEQYGTEQVHLWRRSYYIRPPNGESLKDTRARALPYFETHIKPLVMDGGIVLVVAHGNSLRALVMALDNISEQDIPDLNIPTGAPLRYIISSDGAVLEHGYL
jgi:2,3-bisphosphoglycerate-dependent phosphoglycerate mutase